MKQDTLPETDIEIYNLLKGETERQNNFLELIPSENFASKAVLQALGSVLTNKYSEGYPGRRYYGGNMFIDRMESLAIKRAKQLFNAEHANVQPYSGSPANLAVYNALLKLKDKILSMSLAHGGHLTHGSPVSFSSTAYTFVHYPVDEKTHLIDYDSVRRIAKKEKPKLILSGATAYPRVIDFKQFAEIAEEVNAFSMADISHVAGFVATKLHPSPFPFTDAVTTTTHKTLRGPRSAIIFCKERFAKQIDKAVFPGLQGGPHNNTIAAAAVCLKEAATKEFIDYSKQVLLNAKTLADGLSKHGFELVTGGTDNHIILVNLANKKVTGAVAETALDKAGIIVNKNMIPYDKRSPFDPSGIRIGTPAITTRGMKESEMKAVTELIAKVIDNIDNKEVINKVRSSVMELTKQFPLYDFVKL